MNRIVYISGPITGLENGNVEAFRLAAAKLKSKGLIVRNPHDFCADIPAGSAWETYMRLCIIKLMECTDIVLLSGWAKSKGACVELSIARKLNINVYTSVSSFEHELLREWGKSTLEEFNTFCDSEHESSH